MDFTLSSYKQLISTLQARSFCFQTFEEFIQDPKEKVLILRHDVDKLPGNALTMARLEEEAGVRASYYFRIIPETFKPEIIREIAGLGHEIGYHYEDLVLSSSGQWSPRLNTLQGDPVQLGREVRGRRTEVRSQKGLFELAIKSFELNLEKLRTFYPVKTICMHGSPLSKYDNRDLWEKYDYRDFGIIAEPYFDVDYDEVLYISDTGRSWNNSDASVRDKVNSKFDITIKDTFDLIKKTEKGLLPDKIMINVHPQRWTDDYVPWVKELVGQNLKNVVKRYLVRLGN